MSCPNVATLMPSPNVALVECEEGECEEGELIKEVLKRHEEYLSKECGFVGEELRKEIAAGERQAPRSLQKATTIDGRKDFKVCVCLHDALWVKICV